jgi:hypothetical protein
MARSGHIGEPHNFHHEQIQLGSVPFPPQSITINGGTRR